MPDPAAAGLPAIGFYWRATRLIGHLCTGLLMACAVNLDFTGRLRPEPLMRWWTQRMLHIFGIRLQVHGAPVAGGHVSVANHVSWLDIPLIGAVEATRFVSKSEVRHWPVAGWLANASGTFYIRRGQGGARPLLVKLTPFLQDGGSVTIFPEGTTSSGEGVLPFHPRLFAAAIESGCPVQPVALRYSLSTDGKPIAPFVGDDDLFSHLLRLLRNRELTAEIHFCTPIPAVGASRESLAGSAQTAICETLGLPPQIPVAREPVAEPGPALATANAIY